MADQKITELPIKTSAQMNLTDYLLGIDSAEGYQMLISDIAKKIVEDYAGSTLLGQTQSVANAIEQCNSLHGGQIVSSGFNFDTCIDVGNYSIPTTSLANSATGTKPVSVPIGYLKVLRSRSSSNVVSQIFYEYSAVAVYYTRNYTVSSQTWTDWVKSPTRAEMDNLQSATKSFLASETFQINKNNSVTFNVPRNSEYFVIVNGIDSGMRGVYFIASSSSSTNWTVEITTVYESSSPLVTFDTATAKEFTVSNAHTTLNARMTVINTNGSMMGIRTAGTNSAQNESI